MYRKNVRNSLTRRRSGFALILVLIIVAVAVVLGLSYASSASVKLNSSHNLLNATRAKYLAESGLQHALYVMWTNPSSLNGSSENHPLGPYQADNSGESYVFWSIADLSHPGQYTVFARATTGGVTQRSSMDVTCIGNYRDMIMAQKPMGYWRMGEKSGSTITDETGVYNGTYHNVDLGVAGALPDNDTAVHFDGWADWGEVNTPDFQLKQDLTVIAWVKFDAFPLLNILGDAFVASGDFGEGRKNNTLFQVGIKKGGDLTYKHECLWGLNQSASFDTNLQTGQWYQVTMVRDSAAKQVTCYVNGQPAGTYTYQYDPQYGSDGKLYFGIGTAPGLFSCVHGTMDDTAILDKVLTADQIHALYVSGSQGGQFEVTRWNG